MPASSREMVDLERDLEDARAKLRHAFKTQERFISDVSHELKTPIAVLLTEAQTLSRHDLPQHARKFADSVADEVRRLGSTVESFLTLARVRAGSGLTNMRYVDMNDIVVNSAANCDAMASQYKVQLSPYLLDSETPALIAGDQELLRVMIDNLIRNAIRFSPEGGQVMIIVERQDSQCIVHVRDRGTGICEDMIPKLFDRFVQGENESRRGRGHGLGLAIAKGIAELHGGTIRVRNLPEAEGCEFSVQLPIGAPLNRDDEVMDFTTDRV